MRLIFCLCSLLFILQFAAAQTVTLVEQGKPTSIRGLSVVNNKVAWVSGSKGYVGLSVNSGQSWAWQQVKGYEQSDFRDIEAFSAREAIIMSSGTPALILKTTDGGTNWKQVYRNDDKAYFLDGVAFFNNKHGFIMGDPIDGKFLLLETLNGGDTWVLATSQPNALKDEAAFAASGTSIIPVKNRNNVMLVTGGASTRHLMGDGLNKWESKPLPLLQGQPSQGAFSIAQGGGYSVIVGGDYMKNKKTDSVACYYNGKNGEYGFVLSEIMPAGYQSGVAYLGGATFLSTGTSGSNISYDGGRNWKAIDATNYNVCQKAKRGNMVVLAGDKGKIAVFKK